MGAISGFTLGSGPNPDLRPETATTWTLGADFDLVEGLNIGLTYFDIAYQDTISGLLSNLAVLTYADEYAGTDTILFGQAAYDRIIDIATMGWAARRRLWSGHSPARAGCIDCSQPPNYANCVFVDGRSLNLGRSQMQGIDFDVRYRTALGDDDSLTFMANGTYLTGYDVAFTPGGDFKDLLNIIYQPLKFKARGAVSWDHGPFNCGARSRMSVGITTTL